MDDEPLSARERAALRAWLGDGSERAPAPELLADWLAGRRDERSTEAVERALAQDDALRAGLLSVRASATEAATAEEVARARALVSASRRPPRWARGAGWLGHPLPAAALLLAAAGLGLALGVAAGSAAAARETASLASLLDPRGPL